jgi:tetratricopeptide (TPR) repeat protein
MTLHRKAWLTVLLLALGLGWGIGLYGCSPGGTPPKTGKEAKAPLSPQALEHFRQGHKFLAEKKLNEAIKEFQETARLAPDSPLAQFWVGKVYFYNKDQEQAEKAFKKVLEMDPKNYHAMAMLGKIYSFDRAKLDQAQQYLQQAIDEAPESLEAHFDLGRVYAMKGDRQQALREFAFTFAKEGEFALYHFEMGRILEAWGDKKQALQNYQRALVLNPRFDMASQAIKRLEESGGNAESPPAAAKPQKPPEKKPGSK